MQILMKYKKFNYYSIKKENTYKKFNFIEDVYKNIQILN